MSLYLKLVKNSSGTREFSDRKFKKVCQFSAVSRGWLLGLTSQEDWRENICYNTLRLPAMINTVLKFPHSKFRINWTNISLFVPEFLPWSVSRDFRGSQRCFVNKAYSLQGAVSIRKTVLPGVAIPMLKIRRPNGRLIFNMEIAIRR